MKMNEKAEKIIKMMNDAGEKAYCVGGCVRDILLGKEPHDFDICTSAHPEKTEEILKEFPVIETGTGNCHVYVHSTADFDMARNIVVNAKCRRYGVCNACETLLVDQSVAERFLPELFGMLADKGVRIHGDELACKAALAAGEKRLPTDAALQVERASEQDWETEYLSPDLAVRCVSGPEQAIAHINRYNTGHSEAIITESYTNSQKFLDEVDAACVYVNASTRFTDGFEFGFGAEIGISTQKLHARGPMGLLALTTTKYIIYGNGQVRP